MPDLWAAALPTFLALASSCRHTVSPYIYKVGTLAP